MARTLAKKDVVIMGLGWSGSILAEQLTAAGLNVVAQSGIKHDGVVSPQRGTRGPLT